MPRAQVSSPLTDLVIICGLFGAVLAVVHNLLCSTAFKKGVDLGGALQGRLAPMTEELVLRSATTTSSVVTRARRGAGLRVDRGRGLETSSMRKAGCHVDVALLVVLTRKGW